MWSNQRLKLTIKWTYLHHVAFSSKILFEKKIKKTSAIFWGSFFELIKLSKEKIKQKIIMRRASSVQWDQFEKKPMLTCTQIVWRISNSIFVEMLYGNILVVVSFDFSSSFRFFFLSDSDWILRYSRQILSKRLSLIPFCYCSAIHQRTFEFIVRIPYKNKVSFANKENTPTHPIYT